MVTVRKAEVGRLCNLLLQYGLHFEPVSKLTNLRTCGKVGNPHQDTSPPVEDPVMAQAGEGWVREKM
jgi:hypothetical protein